MLDFSKLLDPKTQLKYEVLCLECNVSNFFNSAESFNNRALRSSPIALLVFKDFNCLRTKDSVILQTRNDLSLPFNYYNT